MSPLSDNNLVVASSTDVTPTKRRNKLSHDKNRERVEFNETKRGEKKRFDAALEEGLQFYLYAHKIEEELREKKKYIYEQHSLDSECELPKSLS